MNWFSLCLLVVSWLMPLHFLPWMSWHSEMLAFAAVLSAVWIRGVAFATAREVPQLRLPYLALPFLILALWAAAQSSLGLMVFAGDALVVPALE